MTAFQKSEAAIEREARIDDLRRLQVDARRRIDSLDALAAFDCANAVLRAEWLHDRASKLTTDDLSREDREAAVAAAAVGVRIRRPVFKRAARELFRVGVAGALREYASHKLSEGEIEMLSRVLAGVPLAAFVGVLDGSVPVTATQYAAATIDVLEGEVRTSTRVSWRMMRTALIAAAVLVGVYVAIVWAIVTIVTGGN